MKWPISYVGCMMNRFNFPIAKKMFDCVNTLLHNRKIKGDDMAWEQSSRLAILLRLQLLAAGRKHFDFSIFRMRTMFFLAPMLMQCLSE